MKVILSVPVMMFLAASAHAAVPGDGAAGRGTWRFFMQHTKPDPLDARFNSWTNKLANVKTKREVVDLALRRFVHSGKQKKLLDLHGSGGVRKGYDYKQARYLNTLHYHYPVTD